MTRAEVSEKIARMKAVQGGLVNRVFHITPFFELSLVLLTTHAHGLYEVTKKISAL